MSDGSPKPTTADLLSTLIDEIRGLRADMRQRSGLPDVRIGKSKKGPEYEGKVASECPADFLLDYAGFLEWKAAKNREEGKMDYVARDEREALLCRRWATVNRGVVTAPEKTTWRKADPKADDAPDTKDSQRDATPPAGERAKWGGGGAWGRKAP